MGFPKLHILGHRRSQRVCPREYDMGLDHHVRAKWARLVILIGVSLVVHMSPTSVNMGSTWLVNLQPTIQVSRHGP